MDPKNNQYVNVSDTHDDEQLVDNFMRQFANAEIADNGFSQQVMRELPATRNIVRLNAIWTAVCVTAGVVLFFLFDGLSLLKTLLLNIFGRSCGQHRDHGQLHHAPDGYGWPCHRVHRGSCQ